MIIGLVWCELQESLSVSHLVTYEIVLAVADTRASALAVKSNRFGRITNAFVALIDVALALKEFRSFDLPKL